MDHNQGVDLALSFQENAGCMDIWRRIHQVQARANDLFRRRSTTQLSSGQKTSQIHGNRDNENNERNDVDNPSALSGGTVTDVAHAVAAAHHANLQQQDQREMWANVASEAQQQHQERHSEEEDDTIGRGTVIGSGIGHDQFEDGTVALYDHGGQIVGGSIGLAQPQLPNPPILANLEEIADTIAAVQVSLPIFSCLTLLCDFDCAGDLTNLNTQPNSTYNKRTTWQCSLHRMIVRT